MPIGLTRTELEEIFNEHLKTAYGQCEAAAIGENPTIAKGLSDYLTSFANLSSEFNHMSIFVGMVAGAILDTIADNNEKLST